jgi:23S rRNA (cytosine1962-C5)-methyltransferase
VNQFVKITLNPGREGSVLRRHPWIFSGAVKSVEGDPADGQTVEVFTNDRKWLARGSYSSKSQIRVRLLSYGLDEHIDRDFFRNRISRAIDSRRDLSESNTTNAFRIIFAESDGLPGVIVDRYGDFLICQFLSAGAEYWRDTIADCLQELWPCKGIFERSDSDSRQKEGYPDRIGSLAGEIPPPLIEIREGPCHYLVDVHKGHKTGFYLDQRLNRALMLKYAENKEVLNAFSYTGGFGIAAGLAKAARVTHADTSLEALDMARQNLLLNNIAVDDTEFIQADVFSLMRTYRDARRQFDLIILDPPKFVASASQLAGGTRGYKDINLLAFKLLRPGGMLITFSCSGYVKPDLFQKIVADAALDAGREAHIAEYLAQSPDHPVALNFPEALYLKGLVCKIL